MDRNTPFRRATPADFAALIPLVEAYYAEDGYPFDADAGEAVRLLLNDPSLGEIWLAEAEGEIAGYIAVTFGYSIEYRGRDAFIDELFVRREFRGRGFGRHALDVAEEVCRRCGVRALHLEVERDKPDTYRMYRSAGFADHDRHLMTKSMADGV